ncbi:sialate O-acetylesterase [Paraflavitalea sp. CAU 1676]|uniref:sialate O-acetylesterase n=1 Tax=Paraflavitalea sp. CAU 1676 TaxID=3032598 RepID=UPI0023DC2E99|nr:sialate O-acetylesterase [Paraflavitalea sp. CAU 1676]MDF2193702.1 sialate O-acetylesterase [Paraflavitalea sp. CAU 1676]
MKRTLICFAILAITNISNANVSLPRIFGDNMVLQRNKPIPVWGWAAPNEKVTVQFNKQVKTVKADKSGQWKVALDPEQAGGPWQLTVKGKNNIALNNILVGEVWVCSGQSNMEWTVNSSNNKEQEIANANFPQIRHIKVPNTVAATPQQDLPGGSWEVCSPQTVANFTAVGYFFARELYQQLNVPIGLINTTWGGTMVETWASKEAFERNEDFKTLFANAKLANLETSIKEKGAQLTKKIEALQGPLKPGNNTEAWKSEGLNDADWAHMKLPNVWEAEGYENLDGVVWFRKTINLDAAQAGKQATIELASIDDIDETYVNGTKVGSMTQWDLARKYTIPAGILKAGKNVIAIRVTDNSGGGGIYGDPANMKLSVGNSTLSLAGDWLFRVESIRIVNSIGPNNYPTLLYNSMVNQIIPYAIEGAIWYQGESNAGRAYQYRKSFPLMINDWRQRWNQGDFPFYFVQLASFNSANGDTQKGSTWAELREAQTNTLSLPNTGMAVTIDIGESKDIHPRNKQDVGKRLAAIALHNQYQKQGEYSGPLYQSMKAAGNKIELSFSHAQSGFMVKDKYGYIKGFEIAGADKKFYFAQALVSGDKLIVWSDKVAAPVAVRYAWADDMPEANLYNKDGFPAVPFRTDNWTGITESVKYSIN